MRQACEAVNLEQPRPHFTRSEAEGRIALCLYSRRFDVRHEMSWAVQGKRERLSFCQGIDRNDVTKFVTDENRQAQHFIGDCRNSLK